MIDKVVLKVEIAANTTFELAERLEELAARNKLQKCSVGNAVYYKSTDEAKFSGLYLQTKGGRLQIKCSLHKQYSLRVLGRLDNSGQFTMRNAVWTINTLFDEIGIEPNSGFVTYYEIGLNIATDRPPVEYIELIRAIGNSKEKEAFNDANFRKNRQKTTEKSKTLKKFFKVYDKGFEMSDRKRQPHDDDPYILRLETVQKRQKIKVTDFFSPSHLNKIAATFIRDWRSVEFEKGFQAAKGTHPSQQARARLILSLGMDGYLAKISEQFNKNELTPKGYRTAREFARDWPKHKNNYSLITNELESEYREKLEANFQTMGKMPISAQNGKNQNIDNQ